MELSGTEKKSIFLKKPKLIYISSPCRKTGWKRVMHSHDFCEILFVIGGVGLYRTQSGDTPLKKGDLVICNPRVMHTEYAEAAENGEQPDFMFLSVSRVCIEGFPQDLLVPDADFTVVNTGVFYEQIKFHFKQLYAENELKLPYFTSISDSTLSVLLSYVLRLTTERKEELIESKKTYTEVKEFIDRNFTEIDTIDGVCKSLYINKYYLTHLFKATLGIPPLKYLTQKRVALAKTLLATTDDTIAEVARACGYADLGYFCRVFKKTENVTPMSYRENIRSGETD